MRGRVSLRGDSGDHDAVPTVRPAVEADLAALTEIYNHYVLHTPITFDLHPFRVNGQVQPDGKSIKLWAQDHEGWLTMDAVATLR